MQSRVEAMIVNILRMGAEKSAQSSKPEKQQEWCDKSRGDRSRGNRVTRVFCFFFQAEDGIRDYKVTGVQTCALPISVDMIVLGSVAKDDKGFVIEAKFYTSGGQLILSQVSRARDAGAITSAAREIAANMMERFPFEGTVVAVEDGYYRINIGKLYRISRGTDLTLTAATLGEAGKVVRYRETGRRKVKRAEDAGSVAEVDDLKKGEGIKIGDRVVRRRSEERRVGKECRSRWSAY